MRAYLNSGREPSRFRNKPEYRLVVDRAGKLRGYVCVDPGLIATSYQTLQGANFTIEPAASSEVNLIPTRPARKRNYFRAAAPAIKAFRRVLWRLAALR